MGNKLSLRLIKCTKNIVSIILIVLLSMSGFNITMTPATIEKNYIVIVDNQKDIIKLKKEYKCTEQDQLNDVGTIITVKTNESNAEDIEDERYVDLVEEDVSVSAFEKKDKDSEKEKVENKEDKYWNLKMINAYNKYDEFQESDKIKVALIDSGIDVQEDLELHIAERKDFINDEHPTILEDLTGHGTSIASVLVGNTELVKGINSNIEIYSARVLDENNQAPISRVVEAIYWAIDNKVDIINISFGTKKYSKALEMAVSEAYDSGILVVAAIGNDGEETTVYPACFDTVLSVGSIDSDAELSDFSNKNADVVAPGEAVKANGPFGAAIITSGTSIAVPHVVGVASLLLQSKKDITPKTLKKVIKDSANKKGSRRVIDYEYSKEIVDNLEVRGEFEEDMLEIKENERTIKIYENPDEDRVEGSWGTGQHIIFCNVADNVLDTMKRGTQYPDEGESGVKGMKENPDFHGYYIDSVGNKVNILASYRYLIKIANEYGKTGKNYLDVDASSIKGLTAKSKSAIQLAFKNRLHGKASSYSTNAQQKAFVFGIAMHTATDYFAHSTFYFDKLSWKRITHTLITDPYTNKPSTAAAADDINFKHRRCVMANRVARNNIYRFQEKRKDIPVCHDFHAAGDTSGEYYNAQLGIALAYKVANLSTNATSAGVTDKNVLMHFGYLNIYQ